MNFSGPNQIIPADNLSTTDPAGRVKLRIPEYGKAIEKNPPISVPGLMNRTVEEFPNAIALCNKLPDGKWNKITYRYDCFVKYIFRLIFKKRENNNNTIY